MNANDSLPAPANPTEAPVIPHETAAPPVLAAERTREPETATFIFHGDAQEYFRIWIVNTLLTLVTFGVFSAWAKVRRRRYLRGNTELLGHRFDYTADPRRILVGNLIVLTLFLTYALFGAVYPALRLLAIAIAVPLLPWIIVRSLAFNAHHTMWRGLRFRFHPSLSAAAMVYLFQALLIPLSLGFYYPAWVRNKAEFRISRHRFGTAFFQFGAKNGPFYGAYLVAGAIVLAGAFVLGIGTAILGQLNGGRVPTTTQLLPLLLAYGGFVLLAKHYAFAHLFNPVWNSTRLNDHEFRGHLQPRRWIALQFTNLAAVIVSCGLLYPWALTRSTRYVLSCLEIHPASGFDNISRVSSVHGSAIGDSAAEFGGFDFGL